MNKMERIISVLCVGVLILLCGCTGNEDSKILSTTISQIDMKANGHTEQLHDYDSPYTICYKNKDNTYSMYIFSSPIQYKTENAYAIIDNTVVKSEKDGYVYENKANEVKTYFPKTLSEYFRVEKGEDFIEFKPNWNIKGFSEAKQNIFTNMYGDKVSAVLYERSDMDIVFYPTKAGIKTEIVLREKPNSNKFNFMVKSSASTYENKQNGYILFKNAGENESIIYQPLIQYTADKGQQLDINSQMNIKREGDDYHVEMIMDEEIVDNQNVQYPIKFDPSFEMYLNKMPDSTVYSKHNVNNYLANYAIVGKHPVFEEGWHYVRFRLNHFMQANEDSVVDARYITKELYSTKSPLKISLYRSLMQWSSTGIRWVNKIENGDIITAEEKPENGYFEFDISEFVKNTLGGISWESETIGSVMKPESEKKNSYRIISTSDDSLYSTHVRIKFNSLPISFDPKENINEPNQF